MIKIILLSSVLHIVSHENTFTLKLKMFYIN